MKRITLTTIFYMLILFNAFAQSGEEGRTTITANYSLSGLSFSTKHNGSGSILTWRDIYLHGGYLNVEFPAAPGIFDRSIIGAGFSGSFQGYWTDDDANNDMNVIHVSTTEATLLEIKYEMLANGSMFNPKLGFDFNMLTLKNYDGRPFKRSSPYWWEDIEGFTCGYDIYKAGFYVGAQAVFRLDNMYLDVCGQIGLGIYSGIGNWLNNTVYKNPVSFIDSGLSFRGGCDVEAGLKLGRVAFFYRFMLAYEINHNFGITTQFLSDGKDAMQTHSFDLLRSSFSAGLKISF